MTQSAVSQQIKSLENALGRTLFYRDGVIVDTQYSNLSPTGYTDAVIDALWPASGGPSRFATSSSPATPSASPSPSP